jgi:predicted O-methyltransferase YrrM
VARADGSVHQLFPVAITGPEGEALRDWVRREAAANTIEIGLAYGISALFICEGFLTNGAPDPHHVVLDPNQETRFANCGLQFLNEAGVAQLVEFHPNPSEIILPRLLAEGRHFDLAFVDGNHRFDGVFLDLDLPRSAGPERRNHLRGRLPVALHCACGVLLHDQPPLDDRRGVR